MIDTKDNEQMEAYSEAVKSGLYAKKSGLIGKYDNVRRYWEDEISRHFMYPYLKQLLERCQSRMRRLRIMDLGCGSADGLEMLTGIRDRESDLEEVEVNLLSSETLGFYRGIELNEDLILQAKEIYGGNPKITFKSADFTKGLPIEKNEEPYDLYFSSYGASSHHNEDETMIRLLSDIAKQTKHYSIIVCDWLGRYSYEWQSFWTNDLSKNQNIDYVVSYIYDKKEREQRRDELQHLYLRLMSRQETETIIAKASKRAGIQIKPLIYYDRSIFTGRHMDTAEYNLHAQPIRDAVNSLHEENMRTDFSTLLIDSVPKAGFDFINNYFEHLQVCWNTLIRYVTNLIAIYDEQTRQFSEKTPDIPASYPQALREMMERMKLVVEGVGWLGLGLPRENIIEPQLGYALRFLMMKLQKGQGCAHGFGAIFEVDKS